MSIKLIPEWKWQETWGQSQQASGHPGWWDYNRSSPGVPYKKQPCRSSYSKKYKGMLRNLVVISKHVMTGPNGKANFAS